MEGGALMTAQPTVMELGVAAIVALLILREVFGFLRNRRDDVPTNGIERQYAQISNTMASVANTLNSISNVVANQCVKIDKLYDRVDMVHDVTTKTWDMHNVFDESGAPKWYSQRKEWKAATEVIIKAQQTIMTNQVELQRLIRELIQCVKKMAA